MPVLNGKDSNRGVYDLTLPREWLVRSAPVLKRLTGTLGLILPVASSAIRSMPEDEAAYKSIEKQLDLDRKTCEAVLKGAEKVVARLGRGDDAPDPGQGAAIQVQGAALRQLQVWLKEQDPGFGGLVRVQNKQQEFLWVHPWFEGEY